MSVQTQEIQEVAEVPSQEGLILSLETSLLFQLDPSKAADIGASGKVGAELCNWVGGSGRGGSPRCTRTARSRASEAVSAGVLRVWEADRGAGQVDQDGLGEREGSGWLGELPASRSSP